MVKRYIQSWISMKYVFVLPFLALGVFASAFLFSATGNPVTRYVGMGIGAVLLAVMIVYYREKISASLQMRKVNDLNAFNDAVMIGQAFFLEDRMLGYAKGTLYDLRYDEIERVNYSETPRGKMYLTLHTAKGDLPVEMALKNQAARVAQFLKSHNSAADIEGINPEGPGTLQSIDPYRDEK